MSSDGAVGGGRGRRGWRGAIGHNWLASWRATERFLNRNRWKSLGLLVAAGVGVFFLFPHDAELLRSLRVEKGKHPVLKPLSDTVAWWGSLAQINLIATGSVWLVGWLMGSRYWQRLALVTAVSCILAGLVCNLFRPLLARPRPRVVMVSQPVEKDGFYGVERTFRGANYHGFPSGHTATTFGTFVPLVTAGPPWLAVPALGVAGLMGWSRMYQRAHYPSDVLMGAALGSLFGVAGAWHLRKVRRRLGGWGGRGMRAVGVAK